MTVFESIGGSSSPEVPEGAIAAAKAINGAGGIQGRPVEIISCDTKADASKAADCGRQAVRKSVVAMVGDLTIFGAQFMPLLAQHKIPSIGLEPATAADFSSPASFPVAGGFPVIIAGLAEALAQSGSKTIAIARQDVTEAAAAGEIAAELAGATAVGPSAFKAQLFDQLYALDGATVEQRQRIEQKE